MRLNFIVVETTTYCCKNYNKLFFSKSSDKSLKKLCLSFWENLLNRAKSIFSFLRIRYIFVLSEEHISANSFIVICFCFKTSSIRFPICICIVVAILSYLLPNSYYIPTTAKKRRRAISPPLCGRRNYLQE